MGDLLYPVWIAADGQELPDLPPDGTAGDAPENVPIEADDVPGEAEGVPPPPQPYRQEPPSMIPPPLPHGSSTSSAATIPVWHNLMNAYAARPDQAAATPLGSWEWIPGSVRSNLPTTGVPVPVPIIPRDARDRHDYTIEPPRIASGNTLPIDDIGVSSM